MTATKATSMNVMRYRNLFFGISLVVLAFSALLLGTRGLNMGIDFTGGTLLERGFPRPVTAAEVRQALASPELASIGMAQPVVQPIGDGTDVLIRTSALEQADIDKIDSVLSAAFGEVTERRSEVVGPVIGRELIEKALLAIAVGMAGILAYITVRFEFRFGLAAIAALAHDVLAVLGLFSLLRFEINSAFVAAVLTVVGYSINDTIVVFDRIRENLRTKPRDESYADMVSRSIQETLPRTINTALTTLLALLAIYLFGGTTIRDFSLALIAGVVVGTYSSIFIASPLWLLWSGHAGNRAGRAAATSQVRP